MGLLSLHDAVEMYLIVLCDLWNAKPSKKTDFLQYFAMLDEAGLPLVRHESMRRLNAARVTLKHNGIAPSVHDIEALSAATTNFLEDNSPSAVGMPFDRISLAATVPDSDIRVGLQEAEAALANGDMTTALATSAVAFLRTIREHNSSVRGAIGERRAYSVQAAALRGANIWDARSLSRGMDSGAERAAERLGEAVVNSAQVFGEAIAVLGHGIDFGQYLQFKTYAPVVHVGIGGNPTIQWMTEPTDDVEIVRQNVAFAVDAAVILATKSRLSSMEVGPELDI